MNEKSARASAPIEGSNQHILEYLTYYLSLKYPPHYAVLLVGPWGIGKTFLVRQFLTANEKKDSCVYISLYGLQSTEEIDAALLAAKYPALDNKITRVGAKLAGSVLKHFRLDTNLKLEDFLSKFSADLYIFDDLERCGLPIDGLLGYLNNFVEHDECKVLLIANENEIAPKEEYLRLKEKLIGKTLTVQSSLPQALTYFTSKIADASTRKMYQKNKNEISAIYHQSSLSNLRILQQTMWDFERVYSVLTSTQRANKQAMAALLSLLFTLSFEVKAGRLIRDDLIDRMKAFVGSLGTKDKNAALTRLQIAASRYSDVKLYDSILSDQLLIDILIDGIVDAKHIKDQVNASQYFISKHKEPEWRTVWYAMERTDKQFEIALAEMERKYSRRKYLVPEVFLHVIGLRLWLSDIKFLKQNRKEIVDEAKCYVDALYEGHHLSVELIDDIFHRGYDGLGYQEASSNEFQEIYNYLKAKTDQQRADNYPRAAGKLLQEMSSDPRLYYRRLCITNSDDNLYYNVPILAEIDADEFVQAFLKLPPTHQRIVMSVFGSRYKSGELGSQLVKEKKWLLDTKDKLIHAASKMRPISKFRIQKFIEWYVQPALDGEPEAKE